VRNLLQKSEFAFNPNQLPQINEGLLKEPAEHALAKAIQRLAFETKPFIDAQEYQRALVMMASIHAEVNSFFDGVLIMTEDEAVRRNRLNLLAHLMALFSQIADISKLAL
jgi:glycyl-tRNA synthetase beta chain